MIKEELIFKGVAVSGGIAIGRLHYLSHPEQDLPHFSISQDDVQNEIDRFRRAIESSRHDLKVLQLFLKNEGSSEAVAIIDSHIQMLDDPFLTVGVEERIRELLLNPEIVFKEAVSEYERQFASKNNDRFFRQRLLDVKDLTNRILMHLHPKCRESLLQIPEGAIVFAKELVPSDTAEASRKSISAFVTQIGGETSHAALIARAKGIPFVASIDIEALEQGNGEMIIVDAESGEIYLNPTEERIDFYRERLLDQTHSVLEDLPAFTKTLDGVTIEVHANVGTILDLKQLHLTQAAGVGLLRTEFLFPSHELHTISEEEQYQLYRKIIEEVPGLPIVFRFFDIGGDKRSDFSKVEPNPALGCRSIRYLMKHRDIFSKQTRALLRASAFGEIRLLLPLITDIGELIEAKRFIASLHRTLISEGHDLSPLPPIGSMIEVPSAALMVDHLASECDFLSVGTNDLMQYTLASDRLNSEVNDPYKATHPSLIRLLDMILRLAGETPISFCGEMASDLRFTQLLLGLGARRLSCAPRYIPAIKKKISLLSIEKAKFYAQQMLAIKLPQTLFDALKSEGKI